MANISASAVKSLRERTGLPMMECKKALLATDGDQDEAVDHLRKMGAKTQQTKVGRETSTGRMGIYTDMEKGVAAMVELQCESAPVAGHEEFIGLATDLARQLATGPGVQTPEELFEQPSPSAEGMTLGQQKDDLYNRIRETFKLSRIVRIDGNCGAYAHHAGDVLGVLVELSGSDPEAAKLLAMHIAAMKPEVVATEDLDPQLVAKEREILSEAASKEGKPESIIEKMVEGRLRNFYATCVLNEQPFIKDDKLTVAKFAENHDMKIVRFVLWKLGEQSD